MLEKLIETCLDKKVKVISLEPVEVLKGNLYIKGKTLDVLVIANNEVINIESGKRFIDNLEIYEFNIDKIFSACYSGDEKYKFIALLDANREELDKLCKGDKLMFKFKEEIVDLNWESQFSKYMTAEEDY